MTYEKEQSPVFTMLAIIEDLHERDIKNNRKIAVYQYVINEIDKITNDDAIHRLIDELRNVTVDKYWIDEKGNMTRMEKTV